MTIVLASLISAMSFGLISSNNEPVDVYHIYYVGNEFQTEEAMQHDLSYKAEVTCQEMGFTSYEEVDYESDEEETIYSEYARSMYVTCK